MDNSARNPLFLCEGNARSKVLYILLATLTRFSRILTEYCYTIVKFSKILSFSARAKPEARCLLYPARYALFIPTCRDEILRILTEHCYIIFNCPIVNCPIVKYQYASSAFGKLPSFTASM